MRLVVVMWSWPTASPIRVGNGRRVRVVAVVAIDDEDSPYVGLLQVERLGLLGLPPGVRIDPGQLPAAPDALLSADYAAPPVGGPALPPRTIRSKARCGRTLNDRALPISARARVASSNRRFVKYAKTAVTQTRLMLAARIAQSIAPEATKAVSRKGEPRGERSAQRRHPRHVRAECRRARNLLLRDAKPRMSGALHILQFVAL